MAIFCPSGAPSTKVHVSPESLLLHRLDICPTGPPRSAIAYRTPSGEIVIVETPPVDCRGPVQVRAPSLLLKTPALVAAYKNCDLGSNVKDDTATLATRPRAVQCSPRSVLLKIIASTAAYNASGAAATAWTKKLGKPSFVADQLAPASSVL